MAVKQRKSAQTLAAGERFGKMNGIVCLDRFQAHRKWEMSLDQANSMLYLMADFAN